MPSTVPWSWPVKSVPSLLFLLSLLFAQSLCLHVVPGSNCTAVCSNNVTSSNTTENDITCVDYDYNSTDVGKSFQRCISCEMGSHTFDHETQQTDLGWALCESENPQSTQNRER